MGSYKEDLESYQTLVRALKERPRTIRNATLILCAETNSLAISMLMHRQAIKQAEDAIRASASPSLREYKSAPLELDTSGRTHIVGANPLLVPVVRSRRGRNIKPDESRKARYTQKRDA